MGVKNPLISTPPRHISLSLIGWLQWTSKKGYVSLQGKNIFLTTVNDWIHKWIRDWTRKWDLALNTSIVWPNIRQGFIAMLSGGMAGRFCDPIQGNPAKVTKPRLVPKGADLRFPLSLYLGTCGLIVSHILRVWTSSDPGAPNYGIYMGPAPSYVLVLTSKRHILQSYNIKFTCEIEP